MSKLPYIPDKRLYAAVMGACSYIRAKGWFNKAVNYYAKKYEVDADDVARYVRIAQGNGQRQAAKEKPKRKYKWFAIEYSMANGDYDPYFDEYNAEYTVKKGLSEDSVCRTMCRGDYDGYSLQHYFGRIEEFDTEAQAIDKAKEWIAEKKRREGIA